MDIALSAHLEQVYLISILVYYVLKYIANRQSFTFINGCICKMNTAIISIKIFKFCYKPDFICSL